MNIELSSIWIDLLIIAITAVSFLFITNALRKKKMSFSILLLTALGVAALSGLAVLVVVGLSKGHTDLFSKDFLSAVPAILESSNAVQGLAFVSTLFTSLMKALVLPLIFFAILNVMVNQKKQTSNKVILYAVVGFVIMVAVSALVAILLSIFFNLGSGVDLSALTATGDFGERLSDVAQQAKSYNFFELLSSFLPTNLIGDMASNKMVPVMIFTFLIGYSINKVREKHEAGVNQIAQLIETLFATFTNLIHLVLKILPYSIFAMIFSLVLSSNFSSFTVLFDYLKTILLSMGLVFILQLAALMLVKVNPIAYLKQVGSALIVAFSTASSNATLPVSISVLKENAKVDEKIANIVPTFGTMMGMAGCGSIFPAVLTVLTYQSLGMDLNVFTIIQIIVIIIIASFGMQGVPGTAIYAATLVLTTLNLPLTVIILVIPIDFFVDMARTALNVNGSLSIATILNQLIGKKETQE